jgi:hypothetical protein
MKTLKNYITEEKNTHMEHVEDLIFNEGVAGTRKAINFLRDLRDMLAGHTKNKITATVKWDGAPAIFAGIDPTDGKFFVAKKGIFNVNPKVYKSNADIASDLDGELADKFKIALAEFSKLGIKSGVYQGDLMFTSGDLKSQEINGEKYITMHPNTIVYAVPEKSALAAKLKAAKIGVVWHTTYTGKTFAEMKAQFGLAIVPKMKKVSSVWMDDANYKDYSGVATFTAAETAAVTAVLAKAGTVFQALKPAVINDISNTPELMAMVKTFNNSKIRANEAITNPALHTEQLFHYIYDKYQAEIDKLKTDKTKQAKEEKRKEILSYFTKHDKKEIASVFELMTLLVQAKQMIINKMNNAGQINTFIRTADGFKITGVEGFVAIDHLSGGAVKIVDRMEFSKSNFSPDVIKGWQK